jgi:hypothetical protein
MLKSIEYIEENKIEDINSESISEFLNNLLPLLNDDFGTKNKKAGKFLLYLRYPAYKDIIQENTNSLDFNIFTFAKVVKTIEQNGYGYVFSKIWSK